MTKKTDPAPYMNYGVPLVSNTRRPSHILHVWQTSGEWRWQLKDMNTSIVAASTEGYVSRAFMLRNLYTNTGIKVQQKSIPKHGGFTARIRLMGVRCTI